MISNYRQMRAIIIYDLPMIDDEDKKIYRLFRKNIIKLGFYMIQYSVYTKVLQNESSYLQLCNKVKTIVPDKGHIIIFKITEKQFSDMIYLSGIKNKFETIVGGNELVIFGGDDLWIYVITAML